MNKTVDAALVQHQATLHSRDAAWVRTLEGPPQAEVSALHALREQLARVDPVSFTTTSKPPPNGMEAA